MCGGVISIPTLELHQPEVGLGWAVTIVHIICFIDNREIMVSEKVTNLEPRLLNLVTKMIKR